MSAQTELLFSYGTLQLEKVQMETFGRKLDTNKDAIVGYSKEMLEITDEAILATSGEQYHPIVRYSGNDSDVVEGVVVSITPEELTQSDEYEVDDYMRVQATTKSGLSVWVYVAAADV